MLAVPPSEGGPGQVGLGAYASGVHSRSFVHFVSRPAAFAEVHAQQFRGWADRVGLLLEPTFFAQPAAGTAAIPMAIFPAIC